MSKPCCLLACTAATPLAAQRASCWSLAAAAAAAAGHSLLLLLLLVTRCCCALLLAPRAAAAAAASRRTIYTQMGSFFVQQGSLMSRDVPLPDAAGGGKLHVPSASMSLFNTLSIILLIPVYDKWLEPAIQRLRRGNKITLLQRIGACADPRAFPGIFTV